MSKGGTWVYRDGKLVPKNRATPRNVASYVISDTMVPTLHMANGKTYDSKSKFRRTTKDYHCVEVGDQKFKPREFGPPKLDNRQRAEHIKQAIHELRNR